MLLLLSLLHASAAVYVQITSGVCSSPVTTQDDCELAAAALGIS